MLFRASLIVFFLLAACDRGPIKKREQSLRPASTMPSLEDDLDLPSLIEALEATIRVHKTKSDPTLTFGTRRVERADYVRALEVLLEAAKKDVDQYRTALRTHFDAYEVYGQDEWGQVFITSYFEPVISGAKKQTAEHSQALYGLPKDLVTVDVSSFKPSMPDIKSSHGLSSNVLRGRLLPAEKDQTAKVVAYADRAQINSQGLKQQAPVLAWVDPIDAFFLEIQGSGVVKLKNGPDIKVGYASQNGHPYSAIGKYLFDVIPKEKMSQHTLEAHLRSLPPEEARALMEKNPSYVFFRPLEKRGITAFGTEVVSGRTIATDSQYFPKGTLAYLQFEKPQFANATDTEPVAWQPAARFVMDQDTGGAIRGPHRVDLFWGQGAEAKQAAGVIKNKGRLVYLVPKPNAFEL